jgi:hypothetical protein
MWISLPELKEVKNDASDFFVREKYFDIYQALKSPETGFR